MVQSAAGATGGIFISYRRAETAYPAAWLYRRLAEHYGDGQLFKDIDSIELGDDFAEEIRRAVGSCDVLLALIGSRWLTVTDEHGRRRLDDPQDYVRLEIEAALSRDIRVVPILVDGPRMPTADELPDGLKPLSRRQALELSAARFEYDVGRLLRALDKELAEIRAEREKPEPTTAAPPVTADTPPATRPPRTRRPTRAWLLAGAGTAIVLILLISVLLANRGRTTAANEPLLRDDFSSRAAGWEGSGAAAPGAGYADGAYRISAPPDLEGSGAASAPRKAAGVWPTAPPRIQITVAGQRLPESDNDMGFGILCRINGDAAYVLTIDDNYAKIEKWGAYQLLKETAAQVDPYSTNDLRAVCTGGAGPEAVHLELWVNGAKVLETTDTNAPLPPGGVGLAVTTHQTTRASVAEFDNFVVEQVAGGQ
jgi:hypothetical protein